MASVEAVGKEIGNENTVLDLSDRTGVTPLMVASSTNSVDEVKRMLHDGADIEACDSEGWQAFTYAMVTNSTDVCSLLIENGCNINHKTREGHTAYELRLKTNLDLNPKDNSLPEDEELRVLGDTLHDEKQSIINLSLRTDTTALMRAIASGDKARIDHELAYGDSDIHAVDNMGWQALTYAAVAGNAALMKILIAMGADMSHKTNSGKSLIHLVLEAKYGCEQKKGHKLMTTKEPRLKSVVPPLTQQLKGLNPDEKTPATSSPGKE